MGYVSRVNDGNGTHLIEPTLYAATSGTASAITASITNFAVVEGVVVSLKITTTNNASATLQIGNDMTAATIRYEGSAITAGALVAGHIYNFVYTLDNSTYYWDLIGELSSDSRIELLDLTSVGA